MGDLVDRGPRSDAVLAALRELDGQLRPRVDFLIGNHERALLDFLDAPERSRAWLRMGGLQTLESYAVRPPRAGAAADELIATRDGLIDAMGEDLRFLRWRMARMARIGATAFVHAGVDPALPLEAQPDAALLWGDCPAFYERRGLPDVLVVHGHRPTDTPDVRTWRIGIDTGAYYSDRLTAVCLEDADYEFLST